MNETNFSPLKILEQDLIDNPEQYADRPEGVAFEIIVKDAVYRVAIETKTTKTITL